MRILVTGSTGFIGRSLVAALAGKHDLAFVLRPSSQPPRVDGVKIVWDGQGATLAAQICDFKPELVLHLAGQFLGVHASGQVDDLVESNVRFPSLLLEGALAAGCRHFINTGTAWQHFENALYAPVNLYAATKQAFADILAYYVGVGGFSALTLELTDTYGPNDPRPKLVALLRRSAKTGEMLALSAGAQWVDFVHVDDVVDAFCLAIEKVQTLPPATQESYAVRSGNPLQLRAFVDLFNELAPAPAPVIWGARPYRPRETMVPATYGKTLDGWTPRITLRDGLKALLTEAE